MAWFWCCAAGESPWWFWQCGCRHCPAGTYKAGDSRNWTQCEVEGLDWYTQSRDAITSTWANILKENRSSFMIDPDGSPNSDALPTLWVSLYNTCICITFTSSSPDPYSAICHRNRELTFIWEEDSSPLLIVLMLTSCGQLQSYLSVTFVRIGPQAGCWQWIIGDRWCQHWWVVAVFQWFDEPSHLLWCGDSGTTNAWAIVGAVGGVISMLQTVDTPDINVICICNDLRTLSCS